MIDFISTVDYCFSTIALIFTASVLHFENIYHFKNINVKCCLNGKYS